MTKVRVRKEPRQRRRTSDGRFVPGRRQSSGASSNVDPGVGPSNPDGVRRRQQYQLAIRRESEDRQREELTSEEKEYWRRNSKRSGDGIRLGGPDPRGKKKPDAQTSNEPPITFKPHEWDWHQLVTEHLVLSLRDLLMKERNLDCFRAWLCAFGALLQNLSILAIAGHLLLLPPALLYRSTSPSIKEALAWLGGQWRSITMNIGQAPSRMGVLEVLIAATLQIQHGIRDVIKRDSEFLVWWMQLTTVLAAEAIAISVAWTAFFPVLALAAFSWLGFSTVMAVWHGASMEVAQRNGHGTDDYESEHGNGSELDGVPVNYLTATLNDLESATQEAEQGHGRQQNVEQDQGQSRDLSPSHLLENVAPQDHAPASPTATVQAQTSHLTFTSGESLSTNTGRAHAGNSDNAPQIASPSDQQCDRRPSDESSDSAATDYVPSHREANPIDFRQTWLWSLRSDVTQLADDPIATDWPRIHRELSRLDERTLGQAVGKLEHGKDKYEILHWLLGLSRQVEALDASNEATSKVARGRVEGPRQEPAQMTGVNRMRDELLRPTRSPAFLFRFRRPWMQWMRQFMPNITNADLETKWQETVYFLEQLETSQLDQVHWYLRLIELETDLDPQQTREHVRDFLFERRIPPLSPRASRTNVLAAATDGTGPSSPPAPQRRESDERLEQDIASTVQEQRNIVGRFVIQDSSSDENKFFSNRTERNHRSAMFSTPPRDREDFPRVGAAGFDGDSSSATSEDPESSSDDESEGVWMQTSYSIDFGAESAGASTNGQSAADPPQLDIAYQQTRPEEDVGRILGNTEQRRSRFSDDSSEMPRNVQPAVDGNYCESKGKSFGRALNTGLGCLFCGVCAIFQIMFSFGPKQQPGISRETLRQPLAPNVAADERVELLGRRQSTGHPRTRRLSKQDIRVVQDLDGNLDEHAFGTPHRDIRMSGALPNEQVREEDVDGREYATFIQDAEDVRNGTDLGLHYSSTTGVKNIPLHDASPGSFSRSRSIHGTNDAPMPVGDFLPPFWPLRHNEPPSIPPLSPHRPAGRRLEENQAPSLSRSYGTPRTPVEQGDLTTRKSFADSEIPRLELDHNELPRIPPLSTLRPRKTSQEQRSSEIEEVAPSAISQPTTANSATSSANPLEPDTPSTATRQVNNIRMRKRKAPSSSEESTLSPAITKEMLDANRRDMARRLNPSGGGLPLDSACAHNHTDIGRRLDRGEPVTQEEYEYLTCWQKGMDRKVEAKRMPFEGTPEDTDVRDFGFEDKKDVIGEAVMDLDEGIDSDGGVSPKTSVA